MSKISIIIPVYNTERYLHQCVDSVLKQSYQNIEIILVDDGSSDASPSICDNYAQKDSRVKVIHKENGGLSDARNAGILASTGKYLMFLDSDDFWADSVYLENLTVPLEQNLSYDFVLFGMNKYYTKNDKTIKDIDYPIEALIKASNKNERLLRIQQNGIFPMSACSKLIRRNFILDNSLLFRKGITAEDIVWFLEMMEKVDDFIAVNEFFYMYRQSVEGSITASTKTLLNLKTIFIEIVTKYKEQNSTYSKIVLAYMAYEYLILLAFFDVFGLDTQNELKSYSWILKYDANKKVKIANIVSIFLGYKLTSHLLRFYITYFVKA